MVRHRLPPGHFHSAHGFATRELAYMLDSLVRVSRRVEENHFVSIANPATGQPYAVPTCCTDRTLFSHALEQTDARDRPFGRVIILNQNHRRIQGLNFPEG